jgi:hypothetical protein
MTLLAIDPTERLVLDGAAKQSREKGGQRASGARLQAERCCSWIPAARTPASQASTWLPKFPGTGPPSTLTVQRPSAA